MKKAIHLKATFDKPDFLEKMVEQLVHHRYENQAAATSISEWQTMETSGTEAYVSGTIAVNDNDNEVVNSRFVSRFYFTCIKMKDAAYKLHWSASCN